MAEWSEAKLRLHHAIIAMQNGEDDTLLDRLVDALEDRLDEVLDTKGSLHLPLGAHETDEPGVFRPGPPPADAYRAERVWFG